MNDSDNKNNDIKGADAFQSDKSPPTSLPKKGPLSFFSGALTSGLLAWLCLGISQRIVTYFTFHQVEYKSQIAQSAATGFKTLVVGISFLATFSFTFIACGLIIVFFRSLIDGKKNDLN